MAQETIEGTIERITFYNEENGYTVLRLRPDKPYPGQTGQDGLLTVVGKMHELQPDEMVRFTGVWDTHSKYGKQFKAETVQQISPATLEGLRRYLGSLKGIGPTTARRIVDHFGLETISILEQSPERIQEVHGIGDYRAKSIIRAWSEHQAGRDVMLFLQGNGISAAYALKIYKEYGEAAVQQVRTDPYRLARDIRGIGFKIADQIARNLGLPTDSPTRIEAGVVYALETLVGEGHVYGPRQAVVQTVTELLNLGSDFDDQDYIDVDAPETITPSPMSKLINAAIERLIADARIVMQRVPDDSGEMVEAIYLPSMLRNERGVATRLRGMIDTASTRLHKARTMSWIKFFSILASQDRLKLTDQQQEAVEAALTHKVSILTGGPGTGKTTTLRAVIRALEWAKAKYALASPTGRAAKRLSEATGRPASTIHRLLGFSPDAGSLDDDLGGDQRGEHAWFEFNEDNPLTEDMLIIDEASMLDLALFSSVLKALTPEMHLMLVGDVDQLPSVGAGDVLRDLIRSGIAHVTKLETIFRQADDSLIVANAHRINQGQVPVLDNQAEDFFMFGANDPETAAELVVEIVQNRIPKKFGLHPLDDIQVLAPMYRGGVGIQVLNEKLQAALNPPGSKAEKKIGGQTFRVGDKVMQTRNNYEKEVFNGDIGRIHSIDFNGQKMRVVIDDRFIDYDWMEAAEDLIHAFAVSVHRSQGSEYPAVVIPLVTQHYMMLQRNLLYTAVTRARQLVVLVGMDRAIRMAVANDKVTRRYSALAWRLGGTKR